MNERIQNSTDLAKSVILQPLRDALIEHEVNETNVIKVFKEILDDRSAPQAVRLNAVRMFLNIIGLVNEAKQVDLEITHTISNALEELEMRRARRLEMQEQRMIEQKV